MKLLTIKEIQGNSLNSPYVGENVRTVGVVTSVSRRGFFLQTPDVRWDTQCSDAIYVYSPNWSVDQGVELEIQGTVCDYLAHDLAKPVTQLHFSPEQNDQVSIKRTRKKVQAIELTASMLNVSNDQLATLLNSLEGMLIKISAGQTFIAPSNHFGDYVLCLDEPNSSHSLLRQYDGGVIATQTNADQWFPGFRINQYSKAPRLNLGSRLLSDVVGALNYRVDAYQLLVNEPFKFEQHYIEQKKSTIYPLAGAVSVLTLNCFNLDTKIESPTKVMNPRLDVDDDWGEGRFHSLARAIVLFANSPDIVALQEIQDNDGAELSEEVSASNTYQMLINCIKELSDVNYEWVDVEPELNADGGQPGGNIRNGFLYNPDRVSLVQHSTRVLGKQLACFEGSRKPLVCEFIEQSTGQKLAVINVHLASKRHQASIFAPENAGIDAKLSIRVTQAQCIAEEINAYAQQGVEYYVTGDFNDTEYSTTLDALVDDGSVNLVMNLKPEDRYDYNHRGKLQVLMHGITSKAQAEHARYEIIHGNELVGVTPGEESDKPSDHAYVIAQLLLGSKRIKK